MSSSGKQRIESLISKIQSIQSKMNEDMMQEEHEVMEEDAMQNEVMEADDDVDETDDHVDEVADDAPREYNVQQEEVPVQQQQQLEEEEEEEDNDDDENYDEDEEPDDEQDEEDEAEEQIDENVQPEMQQHQDTYSDEDDENDFHQHSTNEIDAQQQILSTLNSNASGKEMPDVPLLGLDRLRKEFLFSSAAANSTTKSSSAAKKRLLREELQDAQDDSSSLSSNDLKQVTLSIHESIESLKKSNDLSLYSSPKLSTWEQDISPPRREHSTAVAGSRLASNARSGSLSPKEYNEKEHGLNHGLDLDLEGLDIKTSYNYNNASNAGGTGRPRRLSYSTPFVGGAQRNSHLNTSSRKRPSSAALKSRPRFDNSPAPPKDSAKRKPSPMRQLQHSTDFETGLSVARSQVRSIKSQLVSLKSQFNDELQKNTKLEADLKEMTNKYNKAFSDVIKYKHKVESEQNRYEKIVADLKKEVETFKAGNADDEQVNVTQKFKQNMLKENDDLRNQIKKLKFRLERLQEEKNKLQQQRRKKQAEKINDLNEIQSITSESGGDAIVATTIIAAEVSEAMTADNIENDSTTSQPATFLDEIQAHAEADKLKRQLREVKLKYDKDMSTIKEYLEEIRDKNMQDMKALQESKKEEISRLQQMLNQYKKQQRKDVDSIFKDRVRKLEQQKDILVQDNEQLKSQVERLDAMVHEKTQTLKRILTENLMMKSQISALENEKGVLHKENQSFADSISNAEQMVDQLKAQFEEQQASLEQNMKTKHEQALQTLRDDNDKALQSLRQTHETALNALKADHQRELDDVRKQREAAQEDLRNAQGNLKVEKLQINQLKKENERLSLRIKEVEKENAQMRRSVQEKELALMQQESRHAHLQTLNTQLLRHSSQLSVQRTPSREATPSSAREEALLSNSLLKVSEESEFSYDNDADDSSPTVMRQKPPRQEAPAIPPLSLADKEQKRSSKNSKRKSQKSARGEKTAFADDIIQQEDNDEFAPSLPNGPVPALPEHDEDSAATDDFLDMQSPDKSIPAPSELPQDDDDEVTETDIHQLLNEEEDENEELDEDILKGLDDDYGDEDEFMNADLDAHISSILSAYNVK